MSACLCPSSKATVTDCHNPLCKEFHFANMSGDRYAPAKLNVLDIIFGFLEAPLN